MNERLVTITEIQDWLCGKFAPKTRGIKITQRWRDIRTALFNAYEAGFKAGQEGA